jgi:hypothetical protein
MLDAKNRPIDGNDVKIRTRIDPEDDDQEGNYPETDDETEAFILTIIGRRIRKNSLVVAAKMVAKTAKKATVFNEGSLITLAILLNLRLFIEAKRLVCRAVRRHKHSHSLSTKYGPLKGLAKAGRESCYVT